jgi:DNA-binding HxlR family transcriptional regulator
MQSHIRKLKKSDPASYAFCDSPFACAAAPIISRKWVPVIVCHLLHGSKRYSELRRAVPFLSAKVLTQNLRELEDEEILTRQVHSESARVEISYQLTSKGKDLSYVIQAMNAWGKKWLANTRFKDRNKMLLPLLDLRN